MNGFAILGVLGTVLGLISAGTAVVAFARASYAKATIEALRGDVKDRDARIDFLEEKDKRHEEEKVRTQAALKRLGDENNSLRDLVTNRAELKEFVELAKQHEQQANTRHGDLMAVDEQILTGINDIRSLMRDAS